MAKVRDYPSYDAYLTHQVSKTADPKIRQKVKRNWDRDWELFSLHFSPLPRFIAPIAGVRALCLGARLGCEVAVLRDMGHDAIGVDLVPNPPLVIEGDFHALPFSPESFDVVFSNSLDHIFDLDKWAAEVLRVVKPTAVLLWHIAVRHMRRHEAVWIESTEEVTRRFPGFEVILTDRVAKGVEGVWMRRKA